MPWKNSRGATTEIIASPPGMQTFDWRVSIATVNEDGPFSQFSGYDRNIMVLSGNGMSLEINGDRQVDLPTSQPFAFSGDATTTARLIDGPVIDFNLMVRRGYGAGSLRIENIDKPIELGNDHSFFLAYAHSTGDSILLEPGERFELPMPGSSIVCEIRPHLPHAKVH